MSYASATRATLRVLLFSVLRERVGLATVEVFYEDEMTGDDLLNLVTASHPEIAPYRSVIRLAVNQEYVSEETILHPDDEIALITPVSGG